MEALGEAKLEGEMRRGVYLGSSTYAIWEGTDLVLTTRDGQNRIVLKDFPSVDVLLQYIMRHLWHGWRGRTDDGLVRMVRRILK